MSFKRLDEVAKNASRTFEFKGEPVVFINTGDVLEGSLLHNDLSNPTNLPGQAKKRIKKNDILYSEIRPGNKRYAFVDFDAEEYVVSTKFMVIEVNDIVLPKYLYIFLTSSKVESELKMIADSRSGTFPQVTFDSIGYLQVYVPNQNEQKEIINFWESLDHKIHLNRQTNETLEAMAQAIFKSWFVDFDPVRAKIEAKFTGRDPNRAAMAAIAGVTLQQDWDEIEAALDQKFYNMTEEQREQLTRTAELFPDELVESEIGEVPKGWGVEKLGDVSDLNPESLSTDYVGEIEYINISGVNEGVINETEIHDFKEAPSRARRIVKSGDVIWSNVRPNLKAYSLIVNPKSKTIASTGFTVIRPRVLSASYLYNYTTTDDFITYLINSTEGSAYPAVKVSDFKRHKIIVPPNEIDETFHGLVWDNFEKIDEQRKQNITLSELRDTLLPKLIFGEIPVN